MKHQKSHYYLFYDLVSQVNGPEDFKNLHVQLNFYKFQSTDIVVNSNHYEV